MTSPKMTTYQLDTLDKAIDLYEGLASGKYKLYRQKDYRFLDTDSAVLQDRALALKNVKRELNNAK